jgi:isopentenyl phosphate kinase
LENQKYEKYDKEDLIDEIIELQQENEQLKKQKEEIKEYLEKHIVCMKNGDVLIDGNIDELLKILKGDNDE